MTLTEQPLHIECEKKHHLVEVYLADHDDTEMKAMLATPIGSRIVSEVHAAIERNIKHGVKGTWTLNALVQVLTCEAPMLAYIAALKERIITATKEEGDRHVYESRTSPTQGR